MKPFCESTRKIALLALLLTSSSATTFTTHYDIDLSSLLHPGIPRYTPRAASHPPPRHLLRRQQSPDLTTPIALDFTCDPSLPPSLLTRTQIAQISTGSTSALPGPDSNTCTKAHATILRALTRISHVIYLRTPITVSAQFFSFCAAAQTPSSTPDDLTQCRNAAEVLGSAGPAGWHEWNATAAGAVGVDAAYLYPSALARQYAPAELALQHQVVDISASFNSEPLWWFPTHDDPTGGAGGPASTSDSDSSASVWSAALAWARQWGGRVSPPTRLRGQIYDFEQICLHELVHGLGFMSSWFPYLSPTALLPAAPLVLNGVNVGLSKEYVFNKWMRDVAGGRWMSEWAGEIYGAAGNGTGMEGWEETFRASGAYVVAERLYNRTATRPGAMAVYYPKYTGGGARSRAPVEMAYALLYTPARYSPGSTMSHVDNAVYSGTREVLMRAFGTSGVGLDGYRPRGEPIGEVVQGVLAAMGYATSFFQP
ncbi:uncharacterized protein EV422DRAFT_593381 [Fimicolochytrium jonesii]|uniref:uncharacterized protein n=1 Tax=Fimicolochytrium jonesii TaxID=1396493 RepID=UPI0022FF1966|nr:uncharacterized protein EV422DRAFT_593381 [Fimicolochytrium jonesii]KAI8826862.1 hypothetical protein EV422DRAFT_593381 [Fimicolochytrium jonesii]